MRYGRGEIDVVQGDITEQDVDAIVNAANNELILGSGVAGAINRKGGPAIQQECNHHGPINIGEAAITGGGNLKAKYIIHAASMGFNHPTTPESLLSSTKASLVLACEHELMSIAFPALGTGVSGFPVDQCANIMGQVVKDHLRKNPFPKKVAFVLFDQESYDTFTNIVLTEE